jgi:CRISPR system Cascade subunit CasD
MNVLLLRLVGPLQSWGVQSRFSVRDTGLEPSKSGVIGLICAALGRPRTEPIADLAALTMGVRVDQEGKLTYDFHTAQNVLKASGGKKDTEPSRRYYLADARFLVGLQGDDAGLLQQIHHALRNPVWPLCLGRKSFVPSEPVWLAQGLHLNTTLDQVLQRFPYLESERAAPAPRLRLVMEDDAGAEVRPDQPISFAERRFALRRVRSTLIDAPPATINPPKEP